MFHQLILLAARSSLVLTTLAMDFSDPLRYLGPISPHPAPDSPVDSVLSSAISDPDTWRDRHNEASIVLRDYIPTTPQGDTAKVLETFLTELPKEGQLALMSEILLFKDDGKKLRELRNFLVDAILKPSKYINVVLLLSLIYWSLT